MNVLNAGGRHGLAMGSSGLDLVDAGMVLRAGSGGRHMAAVRGLLEDAGASAHLISHTISPIDAMRAPDSWVIEADPSDIVVAEPPRAVCMRASLEAWSPPGEDRGRPAPDPRPSTAMLLARLDRHGLSGAVITPAVGACAVAALDAAARAPDRLRAVIPLPDAGLPGNLAQLAQNGLAGVLIRRQDVMPATAMWRPLLMRLAAHGLHLHVEAPASDWAGLLDAVLGHGVPVRLDLPHHGAGLDGIRPAFAALERYADHPDLWIGFSPAAVQAQGLAGAFERLLGIAGPTRFLWGSGSCSGQGPWDLDDQILALLDLLPHADVRHAICGANARWLAFGAEVPSHMGS